MIDSISSSLSRNETEADPEINRDYTNTFSLPIATEASDQTFTYNVNIDEKSASMTLETNTNSTSEILDATTLSLENIVTARTAESRHPLATISSTPSQISNYGPISRNSSFMDNIANGNIKRGMANDKSRNVTSLKKGSKDYPFLNDDSLLGNQTLPSSSGDENSTNRVKSSHKLQNTSDQEHELIERLTPSTALTTLETAPFISKRTLPESVTSHITLTEGNSLYDGVDVTSITSTKSSEESLDRTESYDTNYNHENTLEKPFVRHNDKNAEKGKYTGTP